MDLVMKQYVIDQLRESDYHQIREFLDRSAEPTAMEGIYWVNLPPELYSETQKEHASCHPHYFAVSLEWNTVAFELLIRSRQVIRCHCIAYATPEQREYILAFADGMLDELRIKL
jgi:hypothetical protein